MEAIKTTSSVLRSCCLVAICVLLALLASSCVSPAATPLLELSESIVVHSDGAETEYTEEDPEFVVAFDWLKDTVLDPGNLLETAIDPEMKLKEGSCIEFVYGNPQRTG